VVDPAGSLCSEDFGRLALLVTYRSTATARVLETRQEVTTQPLLQVGWPLQASRGGWAPFYQQDEWRIWWALGRRGRYLRKAVPEIWLHTLVPYKSEGHPAIFEEVAEFGRDLELPDRFQLLERRREGV